jgi:multidrug resistance protein MdtO
MVYSANPPRTKGLNPVRETAGPIQDHGALAWFGDFLAEELKPYPGRLAVVLRMVLAATITMVLVMVFQIPGGGNAAFNTLLVSRQSPQETVKSSVALLFWSLAAGLYCLLGVMLFLGNPLVHILWVFVSIAVCFVAVKKLPMTSAGPFASTIVTVIPIWDTSAPTSDLVDQTLWISGSLLVGLVVVIFLEYLSSFFRDRNELVSGLTERLGAFRDFMDSYSEDRDQALASRAIHDLSLLGLSRLRQLLAAQSDDQQEYARRSAIISLTGRLIDISAAIIDANPEFTTGDRARMIALSKAVTVLEAELRGRRVPSYLPLNPSASSDSPFLTELEQVIGMLGLTLGPEWHSEESLETPLKPTTHSNISTQGSGGAGNLGFVLRGTLAASLCYVMMNAIAWRGISTCMVTCAMTSLSSVGSSRQKQVLRISGAMVGGILFGIGAQVFVIPGLDTISGFAALFVLVTFIAAWFATSSPRLSYFGLQMALAFYLVHLQEFSPQTSLTAGRDRVAGIALGLLAMWLVFDTLGAKSAVRIMTDTFARNLDLLAEQANPWRDGKPADVGRLRALRSQISQNFAQVNAQADAVLFEIGPLRQIKLAQRRRLLDLQPRLRSIFFVEIALLQYRITMQPQAVDTPVFEAQQAFDEHASAALRRLAQAFRSGEVSDPLERMNSYQERLETAVRAQKNAQTARTDVLLILFSHLSVLLDTLQSDSAFFQDDRLITTAMPAASAATA